VKATAFILQMIVRVGGLAMIALGLLFWSGNALSLIPVHMLLGLILVLCLWALAVLGAFARAGWGRIALAAVWGLITPVLGVTQGAIVPGDMHWIIQIVHLLVGLALMGQAEQLARRIRAARDAGRSDARGVVVPA
jgi:hypothetical protein